MKKNIAAVLSGLIFGIGLAVSQLINPAKVLAFLDVAGQWDPSLLLVMGSALAVTFVAYRLVDRRAQPLFAPRFFLPTKSALDRPLLIGAAIFGIGWGLAGYCPGPGVAGLGLGTLEAPVFLLSFAAGAFAYRVFFETSASDQRKAARSLVR